MVHSVTANSSLQCVAFHPEFSLAASASEDATIKVHAALADHADTPTDPIEAENFQGRAGDSRDCEDTLADPTEAEDSKAEPTTAETDKPADVAASDEAGPPAEKVEDTPADPAEAEDSKASSRSNSHLLSLYVRNFQVAQTFKYFLMV